MTLCFLQPVSCVRCPITDTYVASINCLSCEHIIERRSPWRYYAVKCETEVKR